MGQPMQRHATIFTNEKQDPYDVERVRADFPILKRRIDGKPLVYLDNAATSQKPIQVIESLDHH